DKQLLVDAGRAGLLDVDTLGAGDAALDLGNLLAHLDLRVRQGWTTGARAAEVESEVLAGYAPDVRTRAAAAGYGALPAARLRALDAFRPGDLAFVTKYCRQQYVSPAVARGAADATKYGLQ